MHKYQTGLRRRASGALSALRRSLKEAAGLRHRWPVYRPTVDHSIYNFDNAYLPSTSYRAAQLEHHISWPQEISRAALIELEHPFVLLTAPDAKSDFSAFKNTLMERWARFFKWFDPQRHHLVGTSSRAVYETQRMASALGYTLAEDSIEVLRWGGMAARINSPPDAQLSVLHYGGRDPFAKGTHDVLKVAHLLPEVRFEIAADLHHPLFSQALPRNVILQHLTDNAAYRRTLTRCHILLNPIYSDGWGVILDALAHAMPIVTYDSYDKNEAVVDGITGHLVALPKRLSFYDNFMSDDYTNWTAFNAWVTQHSDSARVEALASCVSRYLDRSHLLEQTAAAAQFYRRNYFGPNRIRRICKIYENLGCSLPTTSKRYDIKE